MDYSDSSQLLAALRKTLTLVLAGGVGTRLYPLTKERAKPAVVFGGQYRIIDFALSNCVNSGLRKIHLLTQYRSHSLQRHIALGWNLQRRDEFIDIVPPQFRGSDTWYRGTADAIYHNIFLLEDERPAYTLILAGDHIYKMNYGRFLAAHIEKGADLTIACISTPRSRASAFGCVAVDPDNRITAFHEKPADPPAQPGNPDRSYVSMGIYIFTTAELVRAVSADAKRDSSHDFGKDVIPAMLNQGKKLYAFNFLEEGKDVEAYWRDIGDLDAYYEANMDLCDVHPIFDLYDQEWPIHTTFEPAPPSKTVFAGDEQNRIGHALDSLVSQGCIISGGTVRHSILGPGCRVNSWAEVENSILFHGVDIGRRCKVRNAIIDKGVKIPHDMEIGYHPEEDRKHFTVSPGGVVVIPKGHRFE